MTENLPIIAPAGNAARRVKLLILALSAVLFLAINRSPLRPKDPRQLAYEVWLAPIETVFNRSAATAELSERPISIRFSSNYPEFQADWNLATSGSADSDSRVVRILQLAREGQLFALPPMPTEGPVIRLSVTRGLETFESVFSREQVEKNLQAQSLIKLLELYAGQSGSPAALSQP